MHERYMRQPRRPLRGGARRFWMVAVALGAALALTSLASAPPAQSQPRSQPAPTVLTFQCTGAAQTWTVPPGVTQADFNAYGAPGGAIAGWASGGLGGQYQASIAVTPGSVITIMVGCRGGDIDDGCSDGAPRQGGAGGFNGGAAGGTDTCAGGGGGGASDVRIGGADLAHRALVAGGGGGAARLHHLCPHADGGFGGGWAGGPGACDGGAGGTQDGKAGSGQLGLGSPGAAGNGIGGGGGGGGYYGGAGGLSGLGGGKGGGGGAGFGPPGSDYEPGVQQADGVVVVTYTPVTPPTLTNLTPNTGPTAGGTTVTLTGSGFALGQTVRFGTNAATGMSCISTTQCSAVSPAGSGTVDVVVEVTGAASNALSFTYVPAPTLIAVSPDQGRAAGGTFVTLTGTGFDPTAGGTSVAFGSAAGIGVRCASATQCTVTSPVGSGTVNVTVTTPAGTSNALPFTYQAPPAVTGLSPTSGPAAGGALVTVTGTGFSTEPGATAVTFGRFASPNVACRSAMACDAVSPPGAGMVSVRVTVEGQTSADTPADDYAYTAPGAAPQPTPAPGAVAELAALEAVAQGAGAAGPGLAGMVRGARQAVEAGQPLAACGLLQGFLTQVRTFGTTGLLTPALAQQLAADATAIRTTLGCSTVA